MLIISFAILWPFRILIFIFCFEYERYRCGDTASAPLHQIEFDDKMKKMMIWTEFHNDNIFFKRKNDLEFIKKLIPQLKIEAEAIIETLQKH